MGGGEMDILYRQLLERPLDRLFERPLVDLCQEGKLVTVRRALKHKRHIAGGGTMFHTALMFSVQNQHNSVVEFLLTNPDFNFANEANTLTLDTVLHCACQEDNLCALSLLVHHHSKPDLNTKNSRGETPLMVAVKCGSINSVRCLVSLPEVNMATRDAEGQDLMQIAR
jgi:ankyrin repeat protein